MWTYIGCVMCTHCTILDVFYTQYVLNNDSWECSFLITGRCFFSLLFILLKRWLTKLKIYYLDDSKFVSRPAVILVKYSKTVEVFFTVTYFKNIKHLKLNDLPVAWTVLISVTPWVKIFHFDLCRIVFYYLRYLK